MKTPHLPRSLRVNGIQAAFIRLALIGFGIVIAASSAKGTVLTFDIQGLSNGQSVPQSYGDNVTSTTMGGFSYGSAQGFTPNVSVSYGNGLPALWTTGYGDLTNVLFEDLDNVGILIITLTADPGFFVRLHGLQLAAFTASFSSDPIINSIQIFNASNIRLGNNPNVQISRTTNTQLSALPEFFTSTSLRIEIDARNLGANNGQIALDNLTFSQVVIPEPQISALLVTGGIGSALVLLRRRRRDPSVIPLTNVP